MIHAGIRDPFSDVVHQKFTQTPNMTELMTPNMMYDSGRHINSTRFEF